MRDGDPRTYHAPGAYSGGSCLGTITVRNTRATYAAALNRLVADFGSDTDVSLLDREPDRVSGWFIFVWEQVGQDVQHAVDRAGLGVRVLA